MRTVLQILLFVVVIALAYILYESISEPLRFDTERVRRNEKVIERLKQIRDSEVAFRSVYGRYTGCLDSLLNFVRKDSLPLVRAIGTIPEEYIDSLKSRVKAEQLALKKGIIRRDTIRIAALDSLFQRKPDKFGRVELLSKAQMLALVDSMQYIPFSGKKRFALETADVRASGLPINVFEARALNVDILRGLKKQLIVNLNDEPKWKDFPGLKVGSVRESNNNAGNWE